MWTVLADVEHSKCLRAGTKDKLGEDMVDFTKARRGLTAIEDAENRQGSKGNFKPFAPHIQWREDQEQKHILILTPIEDTWTVDVHEWIPVGLGSKANGESYTKYESFISRKDPLIGETEDRLEDKFDAPTRKRTVGAAVELEPVIEVVQGRNRPKGFTVATDSFTRNDEEVTVPRIGVLSQSPVNFWGWLGSFDNTQAPITETPMQVVRRGVDKDTNYDFIPLMDIPVDFDNLFNYIANVSYLPSESYNMDGSDTEKAIAVGNALVEERINELASRERYDELVMPITDYKPKFPKPKRVESAPKPIPTEPPSTESNEKTDRFAALRARLETDG
jgi:hypothetical protein